MLLLSNDNNIISNSIDFRYPLAAFFLLGMRIKINVMECLQYGESRAPAPPTRRRGWRILVTLRSWRARLQYGLHMPVNVNNNTCLICIEEVL